MKFSVLDQSPIRTNILPDQAIRESIALARACEGFGYHRYWLSEHHSSGSVAGSAPEVLAAAIASQTSRIRVGAAGIMLPHYAALKVAEQFRVLEAIAPGRIDLGLGRAPGSDGRTALALNPNARQAADMFPAQVRDVMAWSSGQALPVDHPFRAVTCEPRGPHAPKSGFSAAPPMAPSSPPGSACLTPSPISSPTAPGRRRRCTLIIPSSSSPARKRRRAAPR
ncbi:MsnO8 family LLM class oxidoreductase [Acidocella sp. MX-AZ03]|nr:MsnO8 family LLM class oxidoreductase [Acidocella sp. MX-AZ03]WBO60387.1 MsnO8 family LLM class oxidoreductase [Acidocella sp. MX-AZ03]